MMQILDFDKSFGCTQISSSGGRMQSKVRKRSNGDISALMKGHFLSVNVKDRKIPESSLGKGTNY